MSWLFIVGKKMSKQGSTSSVKGNIESQASNHQVWMFKQVTNRDMPEPALTIGLFIRMK